MQNEKKTNGRKTQNKKRSGKQNRKAKQNVLYETRTHIGMSIAEKSVHPVSNGAHHANKHFRPLDLSSRMERREHKPDTPITNP